jgi:uncharacterized repeat protein (TIGR02543 family)
MTDRNMIAVRIIPFVGILFGLLLSPVHGSQYTLATNVSDPRGGMLMPPCLMGCWYVSGDTANVLAVTFNGYVFDSWSGDCIGSNPSMSVNVTGPMTCTASFSACGDPPVKINSAGYSSLGNAYISANDNDIIEILARDFYESLVLDRSVKVILKGGYGCGYGANPSMSLMNGPLIISKGTVTVENLMIVNAPGPPAIPQLPPSSKFDYVKVDDARGQAGDATQIEPGTTGNDLIAEYGGTGKANQFVQGDNGADWILQVGGLGETEQGAQGWDGDDIIYQFGIGTTNLAATGGNDDDVIVQVGGTGVNELYAGGYAGNDHIEQYGGSGPNSIEADPGTGDDNVLMVGGPCNDFLTYEVGAGNDIARIYGGGGDDSLTINKLGQSFTLYDGNGTVLFSIGTGGTDITVIDVQHIKVIGDDGHTVIFQIN